MKIFQEIEELVPQLPGGTWAHQIDKAKALAMLVLALRPRLIVEIGVFGGASLIPMAMALRDLGTGKAVAIDPWSNTAAMEGYDGVNKQFWNDCDLNAVYGSFEKALYLTRTHEVVSIVRRKSDDVAPNSDTIGLLHVDGQHTEQAVKDVMRFAPFVQIGGIAVLDDVNWSNDGDKPVQRAVTELKNMGFKSLYPLGTGEVFIRVST